MIELSSLGLSPDESILWPQLRSRKTTQCFSHLCIKKTSWNAPLCLRESPQTRGVLEVLPGHETIPLWSAAVTFLNYSDDISLCDWVTVSKVRNSKQTSKQVAPSNHSFKGAVCPLESRRRTETFWSLRDSSRVNNVHWAALYQCVSTSFEFSPYCSVQGCAAVHRKAVSSTREPANRKYNRTWPSA